MRKMHPPWISRCKRTIHSPCTAPLCFPLLYMFFVSFLGQFIAGRPFYSKENAPALSFAMHVDDRFAAYSTFLFFLL